MSKTFRIVWANTGTTLMVLEAENARAAVAEAIRNSELTLYDVKALLIA